MYLRFADISEPSEELTRWITGGTAAILALIVANLDTLPQVVAAKHLRAGMLLLLGSLLTGILALAFAVTTKHAKKMILAVSDDLLSNAGREMIAAFTRSPISLGAHLVAPFWWPLNHIFLRSFLKGIQDNLQGEKALLRWLSAFFYLSLVQSVLGASGILVMALGLR